MRRIRLSLRYRLRRLLVHLRAEVRRRLGPSNRDTSTYQLMVSDNAAAADHYQAGKFWAEINREFSDLIWVGALENLRTEYFNRRFAGFAPRSRVVYRELLLLYFDRLIEQDSLNFLATAVEPSVGGDGDQELIDGRPMSHDFLQSIDEAYKVLRAWRAADREGSPRLIVELGAGYGRLAYVCRQMFPDCTYVILDLPEALTCSSSWLERVLGDEVIPYEQGRHGELTRDRLLSERVWILGADAIERIADDAADAFVNIYSFAEMPPASISNYLGHIDRTTRGIFYTKQRRTEVNVVDNVTVSLHDYPIPARWKRLFEERSTLREDIAELAFAT